MNYLKYQVIVCFAAAFRTADITVKETLMANFSIIGQGNMGQAIASVLTDGGAAVDFVSREATTINGDIVVLAVPFPAVDDIVSRLGSQLEGKTVVDITNPLNFETFDSLVVPSDGSAAQEIAAKLPQSKVLKAFNTNFAATLANKSVGEAISGLFSKKVENTTTVLVAGDDTAEKDALIGAVIAGGINAIDAGSLKRARELEAIGFLQLTFAVSEKINWTGGFNITA
jgi:predicted dinucleotide-binding enzyme